MRTRLQTLLLFTLLAAMVIVPVVADTLSAESTTEVTFRGVLLDYESLEGGGYLVVEVTDIFEDPDHVLTLGENVTITYMSGLPPPYQQDFYIDPGVTIGGLVDVFCTATDSTLELRDGNYVLTLPSFTITTTAGPGGSISPSGSVSVEVGADQTFNITPDSGYAIQDVLVDDVSQGAVSSYTFADVEEDHTISAMFLAESVEVLFQGILLQYNSQPGGGHLVVNVTDIIDDPSHILNVGENATISFRSGLPPPYQPHYTIDPNITVGGYVEVYCTATDSTLTLENENYVKAFAPYTINATAGPGGSISPSGSVSVPGGGSQTFTIAPDSGYVVQDVIVDNVSQGAVGSYTFTDVQANHTISASFLIVATKGTLYVASYPQGATILIDGFTRGQTDQFIGNVPAGLRNVTLTKGGYQAKTLMVNVPVDGLKVLPPVTLQPDGGSSGTGTLYIASAPSGALILIDGMAYGPTNGFVYDVSTGTRNLTLTKTGYQSKTTFIQVPAGELKVLAPITLDCAG